jgi:hypothetical protein
LNNDLDKFAGTWKFTDGSSEFLLKIVKQEQVFNGSPFNYYMDQLSGNYRYIKNEIIVVNTLNNDFESNSTIVGSEMSLDKKEFVLTFLDPGKARAGYSLELEYMGTDLLGNEKIKWTLQQTGFYSGYVPGETPPTEEELDQTMRVPANMILIKQ